MTRAGRQACRQGSECDRQIGRPGIEQRDLELIDDFCRNFFHRCLFRRLLLARGHSSVTKWSTEIEVDEAYYPILFANRKAIRIRRQL